MKKILVVDDEVQILKAFNRMFMDTDYELLTADNGEDALKLIETNAIDMVISDMRMPLLDGYKLLSIIKEKYPKIIRIILSGYAEEKPMFRALLHNVAKLYIFKPWKNEEFLQKIHILFADDSILKSEDLAKLIKDMGCSCNVPENCQKMITQIEEEDMDGLITAIEQDPDISALLLQVSKSAVYGVMPNTVKQAAIYIGLHNLKTFMHWACIVCKTKSSESVGEPELLWKHAYNTNRILLFLYETFLHKQPPEAAMFAGLMHNIGFIMLPGSLLNKEDRKQSELLASDYRELDLEDFSEKHAEIGAYFLDQWDLPFTIYEAALYHHKPLDPLVVHKELVCAIHIAQAYAWKSLNVTEGKPVSEEVFDHIGVSREDFEKRLARYMK